MTKKLLIFIVSLMLALPLSAQLKVEEEQSAPVEYRLQSVKPVYVFYNHNFWLGYGIMPLNDLIYSAADQFNDIDGGIKKMGALSLGYDYRATKVFSVGMSFTYSSNWVKSGNDKGTLSFYTIMPTLKFNWLNRDNFSIYSRFSLGLMNVSGKTNVDNEKYSVSTIMVQVSPIGAEFKVGQNIMVFGEAGIGMTGIIMAGVRFCF